MSSKPVFSQITLTNRIYLFNSAKYLTASKTVACKQVRNFRPPRSFDFQLRLKIRKYIFKEVYKFWNKLKNKINHGFALTYTMQKKIMQMNLKYIHFNYFNHNGWHCCHILYFSGGWKSNSNDIHDVISYLKKGFRFQRGICL
jgi:hypothetical protein